MDVAAIRICLDTLAISFARIESYGTPDTRRVAGSPIIILGTPNTFNLIFGIGVLAVAVVIIKLKLVSRKTIIDCNDIFGNAKGIIQLLICSISFF
jgi:hypothetical protein